MEVVDGKIKNFEKRGNLVEVDLKLVGNKIMFIWEPKIASKTLEFEFDKNSP